MKKTSHTNKKAINLGASLKLVKKKAGLNTKLSFEEFNNIGATAKKSANENLNRKNSNNNNNLFNFDSLITEVKDVRKLENPFMREQEKNKEYDRIIQ